MSDTDKVALWAGLISSIVGIVLSIVAIVLSLVSNDRATKVNDQTIKSLQKIESAVERLSDDSRTLIKAGWEKMLDGLQSRQPAAEDDLADSNDEQIPQQGEATPEEALPENPTQSETAARIVGLEDSIADLRRNLRNFQARRQPPTASQIVDQLASRLSKISPIALALFEILSRSRHLTEEQYRKLTSTEIGPYLEELAQVGVIGMFSGKEGASEVPVYWLKGPYAQAAKVAIQLAPKIDPEETKWVRDQLKQVGYTPR